MDNNTQTLIVQTIKFQLELTWREDIYLEENNQIWFVGRRHFQQKAIMSAVE